MSFYSRFEDLCKEAGLKPQSKEMVRITGVSSPAISNWNLKGSMPTADVLCRLADYFHVSVDYLLCRVDDNFTGKSDDVLALNDQEKLLIDIFRQSDAVGQFTIISTCMDLYDNYHTEESNKTSDDVVEEESLVSY